jgi:hypothetical protein
MTVDIASLWDQAEVLDPDEVAELKPARKSEGGKPGEFVKSFDERGEDSLFLRAEALGERNVRENGTTSTAPHDLKSLQALAGSIRDFARSNGYDVNAKAVNRSGVVGLLFEARTPDPKSTRGPKPQVEAAVEAE